MNQDFLPHLFAILISAILTENMVLARFLGLCSFFGLSKKVEPSVGMGFAVLFVTGCSSLITSLLYNYVLVPLNIEYMKIVVFIIVIASFVQLVEIYVKKMMPALYKAFGVYLVIIATNCLVLGAALKNVEMLHDPLFATLYGIFAGIGYFLAIVLLSYIRERLELADVPGPMKGMPIAFVVAGLMAIAFLGFSGLKFF